MTFKEKLAKKKKHSNVTPKAQSLSINTIYQVISKWENAIFINENIDT